MTDSTTVPRLGYIGLGSMGAPMAMRLVFGHTDMHDACESHCDTYSGGRDGIETALLEKATLPL
jgi:hypothetical protein